MYFCCKYISIRNNIQVMEEKKISIGNKLKIVRQSLQLSQSEMAAAIGIKQSHYSNLESDKKNMASHLIETLFNKFNVSPLWFYNNEGDIFVTPQNKKNIISNRNINHTSNSHFESPSVETPINKQFQKQIENTKKENINYWDSEDYISNKDKELISFGWGLMDKKEIRTFYQYSLRSLNNKIGMLKRNLMDLYEDYYLLNKSINHFNLRNYASKFETPTIPEIKIQKFFKDFEEEFHEIEDKKLKAAFLVSELISEIDDIKFCIHHTIIEFSIASQHISKYNYSVPSDEKNE